MINECVVYAKDYAGQCRNIRKCSFSLLFTFSTHWNQASASNNLLLTISLLRLLGLLTEIFMGQTSIFISLILSEATNTVTPSRNVFVLCDIRLSEFSYNSDYLFSVSFAGFISSTWPSNVSVPTYSMVINNTGLNNGNLLRVDFGCSHHTHKR